MFYVGDKYKLIGEIRTHFPKSIHRLIEPFVGGGSVMMNVDADSYLLNDLDSHVIGLHRMLCSYVGREDAFFQSFYDLVDAYGLSLSYRENIVPKELRRAYPKTYFAKFNKDAYQRLKHDYIAGGQTDWLRLYALLIYGFNHMLRFNKQGRFNLPVGNVDYNQNVHDALADYFHLLSQKRVEWHNTDFRDFLNGIQYAEGDLVYLDPPYLITSSEYNKFWGEREEMELLRLLDTLNERGVKFAISNVTHYRGMTNDSFLSWSARYHNYSIKSNYISFNDNTIKEFREVLVTNYL